MSPAAQGSLRSSAEWRFLAAFAKASHGLASAWWALIVFRGALPALFTVAMGALVGAVQPGAAGAPLAAVGVIFIAINALGRCTARSDASWARGPVAWLHDRLMRACVDPPGLAHLERPDWPTNWRRRVTSTPASPAPPLPSVACREIGNGFAEIPAASRRPCVLGGYRWWAPLLVGGAWVVDPRPAARERDVEGLAGRRRRPRAAARRLRLPPRRRLAGRQGDPPLRPRATGRSSAPPRGAAAGRGDVKSARLQQRPAAVERRADRRRPTRSSSGPSRATPPRARSRSARARRVRAGGGRRQRARVRRGRLVVPQAAPADPEGARPRRRHAPRGRTDRAARGRPTGCPRRGSGSTTCTSPIPATGPRSSTASTSRSPPARRSRSSGQNGAARPRWPSSCAGSTTRTRARIRVDGVDLRELDIASGAARLAAVFQDFVRYELSLRDNVAPRGAPDDDVLRARSRGARRRRPRRARHRPVARVRRRHRSLRRPVAAGGAGPRAVRGAAGAGVVILDEPTAQLDVRGEAEIFDRILDATRGLHHHPHLAPVLDGAPRRPHLRARARPGRRAGLPRRADGAGGRYRTMFDLQASRFDVETTEDGDVEDERRCRGPTPRDTRPPRRWRRAVALAQVRLPRRAAAAARLVRADRAGVAARRVRRAVAQDARQRRRARTTTGRSSHAAAIGLADRAPRPAGCCAPSATAFDFLFRERATIAIEAHVARAAGERGVHRAPRAARVPRPARRSCATRPSCSTTSITSLMSTVGSVGRLAITVVLLASVHPALLVCSRCSRCRRWWCRRGAPAIERKVEESVAPRRRLDRHLFELGTRRARQGDPRRRHRRQAGASCAGDLGAMVRERWRAAADQRRLAGRSPGRLRRGLRRRRRVRRVGARRVAGRRAAGARRRRQPVALPRHDGRRRPTSCGGCIDAAQRLVWLERLRRRAPAHRATRRRRSDSSDGIRSSTCRSSTRAPTWVLRDVDLDAAGGLGGRHRRRERRRQDDAGQAAVPLLRADRGPHPGRRRRPGPHAGGGVARAAGRRVPGLHAVRAAGAHDRRRRRSARASTTSPRSSRRSSAAAPATWSTGCRAGSTPSSARPGATASSSRSASGRSSRWPAGFMRDEPLLLRARRAHRGARRRDRARAVRAVRRGVARRHRLRPRHRARVAPLLDRAHGRPDRRARRGRVAEQGSHDDLMAQGGLYAELYGIQARAYR